MRDNAIATCYSPLEHFNQRWRIKMKRMRYDQTTKASILAAVQDARKSGKTWTDALGAAQKAGYKGNVDSLYQFIRTSSATKKPSAPAGSAPKKNKVKKAKAKPAVVAASAVKAPAVQSPSSHLDITALVHKTVTD